MKLRFELIADCRNTWNSKMMKRERNTVEREREMTGTVTKYLIIKLSQSKTTEKLVFTWTSFSSREDSEAPASRSPHSPVKVVKANFEGYMQCYFAFQCSHFTKQSFKRIKLEAIRGRWIFPPWNLFHLLVPSVLCIQIYSYWYIHIEPNNSSNGFHLLVPSVGWSGVSKQLVPETENSCA